MISVIIPTLDSEAGLASALSALVPAAVEGFVREVIVSDGGSRDATLKIADGAGATVLTSPKGRGRQLAAGANAARFPWLLFLHADTVLEDGWMREAGKFMDAVDAGRRPLTAAAFSFTLDDDSAKARALEALVSARCRLLKIPYGDQGLLVPRRLYDELGGFRPLAIMEDVDFVRRLGRRRLTLLRARALTSAVRYRDGYMKRILRNQSCLALYALGVSPERIAQRYERPR